MEYPITEKVCRFNIRNDRTIGTHEADVVLRWFKRKVKDRIVNRPSLCFEIEKDEGMRQSFLYAVVATLPKIATDLENTCIEGASVVEVPEFPLPYIPAEEKVQ